MKLLFLNPPFIDQFSRTIRRSSIDQGDTAYYPVWLAYAAGVAKQAGHEVRLLDAPLEGLYFQGLHKSEDILAPLQKFIPDIVVVDCSTASIYNDIHVTEKIKDRYPHIFSVLVGTHASALPEETLKLSRDIDAVAVGEYDYTILDLANAIETNRSLANVDGLMFRRGDQIVRNQDRDKIENLDAIPFVSSVYKEYLNYQNYFCSVANYPMMMIITSRGCPFQCSFCVYPQVSHGQKYRARSVEDVVEEFEYTVHNFPEIKEIGIEDDCFSIDKERVKKICELLVKRNVKIKWYCNVRGDLDYDLLKKMKKAGCRLVSVGFESGCQNILDNIHKGIKVERYYQFVKDAKRSGILVQGCFMIGNPGDESETLTQSYKFAKNINCDSVRFYPLYLYPGTEAFDWAQKEGYLEKDAFSEWLMEDGLKKCVLNRQDLSARDMVYLSDHYEKKYCFRPQYLLEKLGNIINNPSEGRLNLEAGKRYLSKLLKDQVHRSR